MDRYEARINLHGTTQKDRILNRERELLQNKISHSLSCKDVRHNGIDTKLVINSGTKPYYKEFQSAPGQKILAGDYIEWKNTVWLVYEADIDDELYIDGTLRQCQYNLFWQNSDGDIISRYAWVQNASAYNNGETGDKSITLQSNQFMVYMPYDDETVFLDNGKRIHMARSKNKCSAYRLTRPDDISYGYGEKGVLNIIFTQDQTNNEKDKLVALDDGSQVWICDYHPPAMPDQPSKPNQTPICYGKITCRGNLNIIAGGATKTFTFIPTDKDGNVIDYDNYIWDFIISTSFESCVIKEITSDNKCKIRVIYDNLIVGEHLVLYVADANGTKISSVSLDIGGGI